MTLTIVNGNNRSEAFRKKYRAQNKYESEPIVCPECGGRQFIPIIHNPTRTDMKWDQGSGHITLECVTCHVTVARNN